MKGCRLTHPRHNTLLPLLLGLELHQVASSVTQTHEGTNPYRKRWTNRSSDIFDQSRTCVFAVSQRPVNAVAMWETNFVWSWLGQEIHMSTYDFTNGWGFVNLHLSFVLFFLSSNSLPLWWHVTRPAHTHFINQEGFVSPGAVLESNVLLFFTVPREAASSHHSGAKSLNTCLCEALYDTHRHKRKYQMQRCLSPWQHSKE